MKAGIAKFRLALPGQDTSYDRKADTCDNRKSRKCAQREDDDFVFRILVHLELHSFRGQRLNRPLGFRKGKSRAGKLKLAAVELIRPVRKRGGWWGGKQKLNFPPNKIGARLASPQPRPASPVNGAGGITGCGYDSRAQRSFQQAAVFF